MKLTYKSVERPATPPTPAKPAQQARVWGKQTVFPFGKFKGKRLLEVLVKDVRYVTWCLENVAGFMLDADAKAAYEAFKSET